MYWKLTIAHKWNIYINVSQFWGLETRLGTNLWEWSKEMGYPIPLMMRNFWSFKAPTCKLVQYFLGHFRVIVVYLKTSLCYLNKSIVRFIKQHKRNKWSFVPLMKLHSLRWTNLKKGKQRGSVAILNTLFVGTHQPSANTSTIKLGMQIRYMHTLRKGIGLYIALTHSSD